MALQKTVNIDPAIGVPGAQAAFLGEVTTVQNGISDGTAAAGQFVWAGTASVNSTALPVPSLWVIPVYQPQASSIVHRTWTGISFHT